MNKKSRTKITAAFAILLLVLLHILPVDHSAFADDLARPILYVDSYIVEGTLSAGEEIIIHFMLRNASKQSAVNNIFFTVQSPGSALFPSPETSNQYFMERIGPGETVPLAVYLTIRDSIPSNAYEINYSISYQGEETDLVLSNSGSISVTVKSGSLEIVSVNIPEICYVGRLVYISVRYINTSDSALHGARVRINGGIEESQSIIDIGTVHASSGGIAERNVIFLEPGDQSVTFDLIYENEHGSEIVADIRSSPVVVDEWGSPDTAEPLTPMSPDGQQDIPSSRSDVIQDNMALIVGAAAIVCLAVIVISTIMKRRK